MNRARDTVIAMLRDVPTAPACGRDLGRRARGSRSRLLAPSTVARSRPRTRRRRRSGCARGGSPARARRARSPASRWHSDLVARRASVATTTSVVFALSRTARCRGTPARRRGAVEPASDPSRRRRSRRRPRSRPRARRRRVALASRSARRAARHRCSAPRHLPTVAPVPAPTRPDRERRVVDRARGRGECRATLLGPGRRAADSTRSKIAAAGTIGTGPPASGTLARARRGTRITPSAAARPNAEPPVSTTASTRSTVRPGSSSAISRVAGAPPRTSHEPTVPSGDDTRSRRCPPRSSGRPARRDISDHRRRPSCRTSRSARGRSRHLVREVDDQPVELVGAFEHQHVPAAAGTPRGARRGSSSAIWRASAGGVSTSAVPTITSVGMSIFGSSRGEVERRSATGGASRRVSRGALAQHLAYELDVARIADRCRSRAGRAGTRGCADATPRRCRARRLPTRSMRVACAAASLAAARARASTAARCRDTRSAATSGWCVANACTATPPIE